MEQLLAGVVRNDRVTVVMANLAEQADVDLALRAFLGDRWYEVYLANVKGMETALKEVSIKLALTASGMVGLVQRQSF